jgi:hypothetical protein
VIRGADHRTGEAKWKGWRHRDGENRPRGRSKEGTKERAGAENNEQGRVWVSRCVLRLRCCYGGMMVDDGGGALITIAALPRSKLLPPLSLGSGAFASGLGLA